MIDKLEQLKYTLIEMENMQSFDYESASESMRRDAHEFLRTDLDEAIKLVIEMINNY